MAPLITWITSALAAGVSYTRSSDKMIHIVEYNQDAITTGIASSELQKMTTSQFGLNYDALVTINGGYHGYNTLTNPGSITRLKIDGKIIVPENNPVLLEENGLTVEDVNSAIVINGNNVSIRTKTFDTDATFLYTGPRLLKGSLYTNVTSHQYTVKNPRTIVCKTVDTNLFIVVNGRLPEFEGMTLAEVQEFVQNLGCISAINLDGGGSSTLYIKGMGVVNTPRSADGKGGYITVERVVSNAIFIR